MLCLLLEKEEEGRTTIKSFRKAGSFRGNQSATLAGKEEQKLPQRSKNRRQGCNGKGVSMYFKRLKYTGSGHCGTGDN